MIHCFVKVKSRRNVGMKEKKGRDNIIPFPGLEARLIEKGLDAIINKSFREAVELLIQAVEMNEEHYNARFGLIVALVELGKYQEAKAHCQSILNQGIGDYLKTMEMYIMILVQLQEYEEMEATIHALVEEGQIPVDKIDHFESMLQFSKRMSKEEMDFAITEDDSANELALLSKSTEEQLLIISKIKEENVRKYIVEIKDYLQSPEGHPFVKTMLLLLLKEQEVQEPCDVEKFLKHKTVIPAQLEDIQERVFFTAIVKYLDDVLGQENPSLCELALQLVERHHYLLFPMEPDDQLEMWAAAFHILAEQYQGFSVDEEEITELYDSETANVLEALQVIQRIEEISSI